MAGDRNAALGVNAGDDVGGDDNVALGTGAGQNVTASNTVSLGTGATATRDNQQMFGTGISTYTMAGIASPTSQATQGTPTHLVTSNAGGDLAAYTLADLGLASSGDVAALQSQINGLGRRDDELAEGIAISLAMDLPIFHAGQTFAMNFGWGGFDGRKLWDLPRRGLSTKAAWVPAVRSRFTAASARVPTRALSRARGACRLAFRLTRLALRPPSH